MTRVIRSLVIITVTLAVATSFLASPQEPSSFRIDGIKPHDKGVPGQILGLNVEGLRAGPSPVMLQVEDFRVEVIQDGVTQEAKVRTVNPTMVMNPSKTAEPAESQRRFYQNVRFVVPRGLHTGAAEVRLSYRNQWSNTVTLTIMEKPMPPVVGSMAVLAIGGMTPERTPAAKPIGRDLGWRLERGATARMMIDPLVDPDDPNSAILVRFKQGGAYHEAVARVTNQPFKVENSPTTVRFMPARDELEVDVPGTLAMGAAEIEVRLKANGQTGDPVTLPVTITDTTRTVDAPEKHAPRLLAVTPQRLGAGQSMLLSIDQLRGLEPDPSKTVVFIEQGGARYAATIERNTALLKPDTSSDDPVALIVRASREIVGKAQIRVFNPLRNEAVGASEPVAIEILENVQPPEVSAVAESTEADLAPLRRMYELQRQAGRNFPEYDPAHRYATISVTGVDYNPQFVRITFEQGGRNYTLSFADFSSYSGSALIVRLPRELKAGTVKFTIQNLGIDAASAAVVKEFKLN